LCREKHQITTDLAQIIPDLVVWVMMSPDQKTKTDRWAQKWVGQNKHKKKGTKRRLGLKPA